MSDCTHDKQLSDFSDPVGVDRRSLVDDLHSPLHGVVGYLETLIAFATSVEDELTVRCL
jgi:hypothetical protein